MQSLVSDKKQLLIDAAIEVFMNRGFEATSVQEITEKAGVGKGTFYLYFSSKDNLVEQVFLYCHSRDVEACAQGLDEEKATIDKLYRRMCNAIYWAINHPNESMIERLYMKSPKYGSGSRYEKQTMHFQAVDKIMCFGVENKELKELPTPLLGEIFFGIASSFLFFFEANPELLQNQEIWEKCREVLADGLTR